MSAEEQAKAARAAARESLYRLSDRGHAVFVGHMTSWMVQHLTLEQLTDLIEELDRAFPQPWAPGCGVIELPDSPDGN